MIATEKKLPSILVDETSVRRLSCQIFRLRRFLLLVASILATEHLWVAYKKVVFHAQINKIQSLTPNIGVVYRSAHEPHLFTYSFAAKVLELSLENFSLVEFVYEGSAV